MPTIRQEKVAGFIIDNAVLDNPLNGGEILAKVGYSKGIQKTPSRVFESQGVKTALEESGFTEENAMRVVQEIMLNKEVEPNARLKATDQVFKVRGTYAPEKHVNANIQIDDISRNKTKSAISRFLQRD